MFPELFFETYGEYGSSEVGRWKTVKRLADTVKAFVPASEGLGGLIAARPVVWNAAVGPQKHPGLWVWKTFFRSLS